MVKSAKLRESEKKREVQSSLFHARSIVESSLASLATISAEQKITPLYDAPDDAMGHARLQMIDHNAGYFNEPRISKLI